MLDLELLKRINTIHETGSFSKAADKLFVSRQALITQIVALEKQIGFALFNRTNHGATLSPAGHIFLKNSFKIYNSYQDMLRKCNEAAAGLCSIRIGSLPNLPGVTLPKICREYHKRYPEVKLNFLDYPLQYYFELFNVHSFDVMTENMMNYYHHVEDLCFLPLQKVRQHIGVAKDSPLARKRKLKFADLRGHSLIMYHEGIGKAEDLLRNYIRQNEPEIDIIDINNYDSSLITKCTLENAMVLLYTSQSYPGLVGIPADWDIPIEQGIGYHKNPSPEVQRLLELTEDMNKRINLIG